MSNADLWYVKLAQGDVHRVTLDQLDQAFQAGHIDEETMVLAAGATQWTKLGQLAGLDEAPPVQVVAPRAAPAPMPCTPTPALYLAAPTPNVPGTHSFRPVSVDLSDVDTDFAAIPVRKASGTRWGLAVIAMAVLGSVGAVAVKRPPWASPYIARATSYVSRAGLGGRSFGSFGTAAQPPPAVANEAAAPPSPAPATPVVAAAEAIKLPPSGASPLSPQFTDQANPETKLTPEQKQKLLDADKDRAQKAKSRPRGSAAHGAGAPKVKSTGFTTGGSKFDPLNSSI
jgi:GYF domain 2